MKIRLHLGIVALIFLPSSYAWRNFIIIFEAINCTVNDNYIAKQICLIDITSSGATGILIDGQMQKQITDVRLDFSVELQRTKMDTVTLFKINNVAGCSLFSQNSTFPFLKILKGILLKHGEWPECPIPADYRFLFRDIIMDPEALPSYVPETDFKVACNLYDKRKIVFQSLISGKVIYRKQNNVYRRLKTKQK